MLRFTADETADGAAFKIGSELVAMVWISDSSVRNTLLWQKNPADAVAEHLESMKERLANIELTKSPEFLAQILLEMKLTEPLQLCGGKCSESAD